MRKYPKNYIRLANEINHLMKIKKGSLRRRYSYLNSFELDRVILLAAIKTFHNADFERSMDEIHKYWHIQCKGAMVSLLQKSRINRNIYYKNNEFMLNL